MSKGKDWDSLNEVGHEGRGYLSAIIHSHNLTAGSTGHTCTYRLKMSLVILMKNATTALPRHQGQLQHSEVSHLPGKMLIQNKQAHLLGISALRWEYNLQ